MRDNAVARGHAKEYRESRKAMGFKHVTCYVPQNMSDAFNLYVERLRAEHFLYIATSLSPTGGAMQALATRYYPTMPTKVDLMRLREWYNGKDKTSVNKKLEEIDNYLEECSKAQYAASNVDSESEHKRFMALSIAYGHLAAAYWRTIYFELTGKLP